MSIIELRQIASSRTASYIGLLLSAGCLTGAAFVKDHTSQAWLCGGAVASAIISEVTATAAMKQERLLNDADDITLTLRNRELLEGRIGTAQTTVDNTPKPVEKDVLAKPTPYRMTDLNSAAHILMYAGTGSGKSVVGDWLVEEVLDGLLIDLNPHLDKRDGAEHFEPETVEDCLKALHEYERGERDSLKVGAGRNLNAIALMLEALGGLMDERYELGWMNAHVQFNVRIEESPIIANSEISKEIWKQVSKPAIREARKVKLRYFIVTQSKRVNALQWQGAGDLLDNLVQIRLGRMALEHATRNCDDDVTYWLRHDFKEYGYCWLVENEWSPYQDLSYRAQDTSGAKMSALAQDIWKSCKPGEETSARDLKRKHKHLKDIEPDTIRAAFLELAEHQYGSTAGDGDRLKFTRFEV
jgi:hypothetical protein